LIKFYSSFAAKDAVRNSGKIEIMGKRIRVRKGETNKTNKTNKTKPKPKQPTTKTILDFISPSNQLHNQARFKLWTMH